MTSAFDTKFSVWKQKLKGEDTHFVDLRRSGTSIFGVCDGHNGPQAAQFCEAHIPNELLGNLEAHAEGSNHKVLTSRPVALRRAMAETFVEMDRSLFNVGRRQGRQCSGECAHRLHVCPFVHTCTQMHYTHITRSAHVRRAALPAESYSSR